MYTSTTKIRVRYADTDQMGYVYYGKYAEYYEVGRVEAMRALGFTYADLEKVHKVLMPVAKLEIKYRRPAYYDNLLTIETNVVEMPDAFMRFETKIYNEEGELINIGKVLLAFISDKGERLRVPPVLENPLKQYFNA